jgi:hypothetical protein
MNYIYSPLFLEIVKFDKTILQCKVGSMNVGLYRIWLGLSKKG